MIYPKEIKQIKPSEVYGEEAPVNIPSTLQKRNAKLVDFRPPRKGDNYIAAFAGTEINRCYEDNIFAEKSPRFIVEFTDIQRAPEGWWE